MNDRSWFCISDAFLEDQISRSLHRMKLETIDLFLLNILLETNNQKKLEEDCSKAFQHLEKEAESNIMGSVVHQSFNPQQVLNSSLLKDCSLLLLRRVIWLGSSSLSIFLKENFSPKKTKTTIRCLFPNLLKEKG